MSSRHRFFLDLTARLGTEKIPSRNKVSFLTIYTFYNIYQGNASEINVDVPTGPTSTPFDENEIIIDKGLIFNLKT